MKTRRAAIYVRCSTGQQDVAMQERELRRYAARRGWRVQHVYRDEGVSGTSASRPGLNALMQDCQRGRLDVVLVWKFDRFARSLSQLVNALARFKDLGIDFVSSTEQVDTALPQGELVFGIFGAVAQFEKALISERVKAGLSHARYKGTVLGRPALRRLTSAEIAELRRDRRAKRFSFRKLAGKWGVSVWTAHRLCNARG